MCVYVDRYICPYICIRHTQHSEIIYILNSRSAPTLTTIFEIKSIRIKTLDMMTHQILSREIKTKNNETTHRSSMSLTGVERQKSRAQQNAKEEKTTKLATKPHYFLSLALFSCVGLLCLRKWKELLKNAERSLPNPNLHFCHH